ncbi:MAG: TetR/AcrR family transcriptional regulator [Candidatus Saccharibacteria bacterium]
MAEMTNNQRSEIEQSEKYRSAFLEAATSLFEESEYSGIRVEDVFRRANRSTTTFYKIYKSKNEWAIDVLDSELNKAVAEKSSQDKGVAYTPYLQALGRLILFENVTLDLPGITQAPVENRALTGASYSELLPNFHAEVNRAFKTGQEHRVFRTDVDSSQLADFTIDSLALACLIRINTVTNQTIANVPSLLLNGTLAK